MVEAASYRVRLLGPVDVLVGGRPVPPDRKQIRRLLSIVGAFPGRAVSVDEIVDLLWPDGPPREGQSNDRTYPKNPRSTVRGYVARIPKSPKGVSVVKHVPAGYRIEPALVDIWYMRQLIESASRSNDLDGQITMLLAVRELWRGQPFGDANDVQLLAGVASQLEDTYMLATCSLAEAFVRNGEPGRATVVLRSEFERSPDHERVGSVLADALARDGRRNEALDVLARMRSAVLDVGLDLSHASENLEQAILHGAVDMRETVWMTHPAADVPFVGRDAVVRSLVASCQSRQTSIVVGEAGLGKSSLLERLEAALVNGGHRVLRLNVDRDPVRPLSFLADVAGGLLAMGSAVKTDQEQAALWRLSPALAAKGSEASLNRSQFAEHLTEFLVRALSEGEVVLAVDNLQHLDPFSSSVVADVAQGPSVCVVGTCRSEAQVASLSAGHDGAGLSVLQLEPLTVDEVAAYVALRLPHGDDGTQAPTLRQRSGGNPLFLRLLVDLEAEGRDSTGVRSAPVMMAVSERLNALSSRTQETLQVAAALGATFALDTLIELRPGCDADLRDAADAQLMSIDLESRRGRFLHGLVAETVYEMIPEGLRAEIHDRIGLSCVRLGVRPAGYSPHFVRAAALDPVRAVRSCMEASSEDVAQYAVETATGRLKEALRIVDQFGLGETELAAEALVALGRLQRLVADPAHVATLTTAAELAERIGADEVFASAVIELGSHGGLTRAGRNDGRLLRYLDVALGLSLSERSRAALLAAASTVTALTPDYGKGQDYFLEAVAMAQLVKDPKLDAQVLVHAHLGLSHPKHLSLREGASRRLAEVAEGDTDLLWEAEYLAFWHHLIHANPGELKATVERLRSLTPAAAHRNLALTHVEVAYAQACGDYTAAEALLADAVELAKKVFPGSWAVAHHSSLLASIRDGQGRLAEVSGEIEAFVAAAPDFPNWGAAAALAAAESGDFVRARQIVGDLSADHFGRLFNDLTWTATVSVLGRVVALLGDGVHATELYELLLPHRDRLSWAGTCSFGPNDRALGELARLLGDETAALAHFEAAVAITERMRSREAV